MNEKKVLNLLGLAQNAGRVKSGGFLAEKAVRDGYAELILVAEDASDSTKDKYQKMCQYYEVTCRILADKELLGRFTGNEVRSVAAVCDRGFAKAMIKLIDA